MKKMKVKCCTLAVAVALIVCLSASYDTRVKAQGPAIAVPTFEVDPAWPKRLPNNYIVQNQGGIFVDAKDHVWIITRPKSLTKDQTGPILKPPTSTCCIPAPPVIEFDEGGNFVQGWGGPGQGYEWMKGDEHAITVDHKGNVWVSGGDTQILKFTNNGKFLMQIGHSGVKESSNDFENAAATQLVVWEKTNELFASDGYGNRRVIVFDADTGRFKRMWGAYGNKPDDSVPKTRAPFNGPGESQFTSVHGISISRDGLVYVSDRVNCRVQVFTIDGKFLKEAFVARTTLDPRGTAYGVAFSPDPEQKFAYVNDGPNYKIHILLRDTMQEVGEVTYTGDYNGAWKRPHSLAIDSKGNLYVLDSFWGRINKFVFKGMSTAATRN